MTTADFSPPKSEESTAAVPAKAQTPAKKGATFDVPHKALEGVPGRVIQFHKKSSNVTEVGNFLEYVAHEMMSTDLAVAEAGFPTAPSVLIVADTTWPNANYPHRWTLHTHLRTKAKYKSRQYGVPYENEHSINRVEARYLLDDIFVDKETGLHYYTGLNAQNATEALDVAREFFDVVLVSPTLDLEVTDYPFDQVYVSGRHKVEGDNVVRLRSNMYHLQGSQYINMGRKDDELVLHYDNSRRAEYIQFRAQATDLARRILGVLGKETSWDVVPRPNLVSHVLNKMATKVADHRDISVQTLAHMSTLYAFATPLALIMAWGIHSGKGNPAFDNLFVWAILGMVILFVPFVVLTGPAVFDRVLFGIPRRKKLLRSLKEDFFLYPQRPVHETAIAQKSTVEQSLSTENIVSRSSTEVTLPSLTSRLEEVVENWMSYELDPVKYLAFPLITDATDATTAAFLGSMDKAKRAMLEAANPAKFQGAVNLGKLESLVEAVESDFRAAEYNAKKKGLSYLSADERKTVKKASSMAAIMKDEAASPNEKRLAFEQVNKVLEGVLPPLNPKVVGLLAAS